MMRNRITFLIILCFLFQQTSYSAPLVAPLNLTQASLETLKIGVVAAVTGSVTIGGKGQVGHIVQSGEPVYIGDTVSTDSQGTLQILLLDETVFTIGPNSAIMIDKFIYDPATESGQVNAKVMKGVFRFVTGKIARKKPSDMKVDLPSGSIGVRGTIVSGEVIGNKSTVILLGPGARNNTNSRIGQITVGNGNKEVTVTRPGFGTMIDGPGSVPAQPFQIPAEELARITTALMPPVKTTKNEGQEGGGDPTQEAGQDTAAGGDSAKISSELNGLLQSLSAESSKAAQTAISSAKILDGISIFNDLLRVQTGLFHYSQSNTQLLKNGVLVDVNDRYNFDMDINFGSRTIGGGVATNKIFANLASNSLTNVTYQLISLPFGSGSDSATFKFTPSVRTSGTCGSCGSADIAVTLNNQNGVVADTAQNSIALSSTGSPTLDYSGSGTTGSRS